MNYYNPYFFNIPTSSFIPRNTTGLFSSIFKGGGIKFSSIINGTQKALGFVNQVIPVVKQVQPMFKNAKTMFRVMNEFKKTDTKSTNHNSNNQINQDINSNLGNQSYQNEQTSKANHVNQGPTFFI